MELGRIGMSSPIEPTDANSMLPKVNAYNANGTIQLSYSYHMHVCVVENIVRKQLKPNVLRYQITPLILNSVEKIEKKKNENINVNISIVD